MKTITLQQAHDLISNASAIELVDYDACNITWLVDIITGYEHREWLYVSWEGSESLMFCIKADEGGNQNINVDGDVMEIQDTEGDSFRIKILMPVHLEKEEEL